MLRLSRHVFPCFPMIKVWLVFFEGRRVVVGMGVLVGAGGVMAERVGDGRGVGDGGVVEVLVVVVVVAEVVKEAMAGVTVVYRLRGE